MNDHLFYDITYIPEDSEFMLESKNMRELLVLIKSYTFLFLFIK